MATYSTTNLLKTYQALALRTLLLSTGRSMYLCGYEGSAYTGTDTIPDDLVITEAATISDIVNPLFFKKIESADIKYVIPDNDGLITMYSQRYTEVAEANIFTNNVRHLYIDLEITSNEINVSNVVRGFCLVGDLKLSGGTAASNSTYLASECDLTLTTGNYLFYNENRTKYTRTATEAGELIRILFAI